MKQKKKNSFWTFVCAFIPGAGEMYMGFMKSGVSILGIFMLSIFIPSFFNAEDYFIIVAASIWAFAFFHARNVAYMSDEDFMEYEDKWIWDEMTGNNPTAITNRIGQKRIAIIYIVFGVAVLWNMVLDVIGYFVPEAIWDEIYDIVRNVPGAAIAVLIIMLGVKMIKGKKEELQIEDKENS